MMQMLFNATVDIAIISVGVALLSQFLQDKIMGKNVMKERQQKIKEKRQKMQELLKKSDRKSQEELKEVEKEMMQMTSEMMQGSMRYMMFTLPIFAVVFFIIGSNYGTAIIDLPIALPWIDGKWHTQTNWIGWYIICALLTSMLVKLILNVIQEGERNAK